MDEIFLASKPKGVSSFRFIQQLKKKLKANKIGHAGTLDPLASGLLIVATNKKTKNLNRFVNLPKTYLMEVLLGKKTETGDLEGKVIEQRKVGEISSEKVKKVLKAMEGTLELPVPLYSAVKIKGTPLYKLARKGVSVQPPKRKMKIHSLRLLGQRHQGKYLVLKVAMKSASGVYARSVAEAIGQRLRLPATIKNLQRTAIGRFSLPRPTKGHDVKRVIIGR